MEEALKLIASFLGGAIVSGILFMFAFVSRLTKVETQIANLCKDMGDHIKAPTACALHTEMMERLARVETQVEERNHE